MKKPRLRLTSPWFGPTWTNVLLSGVHTNKTRNIRLKWSREDLHVLLPIDTGTPAASPTCLTILQIGWESHETRRSKLQLIVLYKIVHGLIDIPHTDYLTQTSSRTRTAHKYKDQQYSTSTDCFESFFPGTIPLWNRLPAVAAEAPSLVSFKRDLSNLTF